MNVDASVVTWVNVHAYFSYMVHGLGSHKTAADNSGYAMSVVKVAKSDTMLSGTFG